MEERFSRLPFCAICLGFSTESIISVKGNGHDLPNRVQSNKRKEFFFQLKIEEAMKNLCLDIKWNSLFSVQFLVE